MICPTYITTGLRNITFFVCLKGGVLAVNDDETSVFPGKTHVVRGLGKIKLRRKKDSDSA